jgi:hypothetical protein
MIRVELRVALHARRVLLVVRDRVVTVRHAALGIDGAGEIARQHQRRDARDVRLERQDLQVEHQIRVLGKRQLGHFRSLAAHRTGAFLR